MATEVKETGLLAAGDEVYLALERPAGWHKIVAVGTDFKGGFKASFDGPDDFITLRAPFYQVKK